MDRQEPIAQLVQLTGVSEDMALGFLEMSDWDLGAAVDLAFAALDGQPAQAAPPPSKPVATTALPDWAAALTSTLAASMPTGIPDTGGVATQPSAAASASPTPMIDEEYDAQVARALQESLQQQDAAEDTVRAPIAPKETILSAGGDDGYDAVSAFGSARSSRRGERGFNPRAPAPVFEMFRDFRSEARTLGQTAFSGTADERAKINRLEQLFRPPVELISKDTFDGAKQQAMAGYRWLLVNIQASKEFACQQLNRDTWSDPRLQALIKQAFVFWQRPDDSEQGAQYLAYYPRAHGRPHIGVIDPRTGELVHQWDHFMPPDVFLRELSDLMRRHAHDYGVLPDFEAIDAAAPAGSSGSKKPSTSAAAASSRPAQPAAAPATSRRSLSEASEEEQIAAAIAASMASAPASTASAPARPAPTSSTVAAGSKRSTSAEDNEGDDANASEDEADDYADDGAFDYPDELMFGPGEPAGGPVGVSDSFDYDERHTPEPKKPRPQSPVARAAAASSSAPPAGAAPQPAGWAAAPALAPAEVAPPKPPGEIVENRAPGSGDCQLQIRLPSGGGGGALGAGVPFRGSDTLRLVHEYVARRRASAGQAQTPDFDLAQPFPRKVFGPDDLDKTLAELALTPRSVLLVEDRA